MPESMIRGDTMSWYLEFRDADDDPFDLADCTIWFTAKLAADNDLTDAEAVISHYIDIDTDGDVITSDGFTIGGIRPSDSVVATLASDGVLTQKLSKEVSTAMDLGTFVWDVQIEDKSSDDVTTTLIDSITFTADITRRTSTP